MADVPDWHHDDPPVIDRTPSIPDDSADIDCLKVVRRLQQFDHEAFVVGGAVRDFLCGVVPKDYDVATSATPKEVKNLFNNSRLIGRRFRLAHIYFKGGKIIETATFRGEDPAVWDRNDKGGFTYGSARQDAFLRDFTINALFWDPLENVVTDYVGGLRDVEEGVLRTIGPPDERFRDDPVRIARGIKTAAKLEMSVDRETAEAMVRHRGDMEEVSPRRLLEEILKLLASGAAGRGFRIQRQSGILHAMLPELGGEDPPEAFFQLLDALDERPPELRNAPLGLATLFLPILRKRETGDPLAPVDIARKTVEDAIQGFGKRRSMARADRAAARDIICLQPTLARGPSRRGSPGGIRKTVRRRRFREALELLRMWSEVRGDGQETADAWAEAAREYGQGGGKRSGKRSRSRKG